MKVDSENDAHLFVADYDSIDGSVADYMGSIKWIQI